jgi:hypothetical protein
MPCRLFSLFHPQFCPLFSSVCLSVKSWYGNTFLWTLNVLAKSLPCNPFLPNQL